MTRPLFDFDISEDVAQLILRSGIDPESFRGKTVLVTGGTGFFGIWFLSALVAIRDAVAGQLRIIALSRAPEIFIQKYKDRNFSTKIEFIRGDIKNFVLPPDVYVTHLIHMATTNAGETFSGEDQLKKLDMLYIGTRHVLEQCGPALENVLFTSSGVAYGINTRERISETDFTGPDTTDLGSALGIGKLLAEYLVTYFADRLGYKYSLARCFAFAGQYLPTDLHYAFGNFIQNARLNEDIVIRGDGQDVRSYQYIGDAIAWLLCLLVEPQNQTVNVGSSRAVSIEQLANVVASAVAPAVGVTVLGKPNATGNFRRAAYVPDVSKILRTYPHLSEWTSLEEIVRKMLKLKPVSELEASMGTR